MPQTKVKAVLDDVLNIDMGQTVANTQRSGKWPAVERAYLRKHPVCAVCSGRKHVNAHHILPFHLYPDRELDRDNLITLCRGPFNCHLLFGHLGDYKGFNPLVRADAEIWRFRLRARRALIRLSKESR